MNQSLFVANFIDALWNKGDFGQIQHFLHPEYIDHSLPAGMPAGSEGTLRWIAATGIAFEHHTRVVTAVSEGNTCICRVRMRLKQVGEWRGIAPAGKEVEITGYREFWFKDGKIIAHHALMDGEAIEQALRQTMQGCVVR